MFERLTRNIFNIRSKTFKKAAAIFMLFAFLCQPAAAFASGLTKAEDIAGSQKSNIYYGSYWQNKATGYDPTGTAEKPEEFNTNHYTKTAVKYRVLDNNSGTGQILVLSDKGLYADQFNSASSMGNRWATSEIRGTLNNATATTFDASGNASSWGGFAGDAFSAKELAAIADTTHTGGGSYANSSCQSTEKIFLLSAGEAQAYGFVSGTNANATRKMTATEMAQHAKMYDNSRAASDSFSSSYWFLRSPGSTSCSSYSVDTSGGVGSASNVYTPTSAARAAFNLNSDSILFASAATGGKSDVTKGSGFSLADYPGSDYKLTLYDETIATPSDLAVTQKHTGYATVAELAKAKGAGSALNLTNGLSSSWGTNVNVSFNSSAITDNTANYVSAVVKDKDGNLVNYAKVSNAATGKNVSVGTGSLENGSYEMYLFAEQANGEYETDYASALSKGYTIHKGDVTTNEGTLTSDYKNSGYTAQLGNGFNLSFEGAGYNTNVSVASTGASVFGAGSTIKSLAVGGNTNVSGSMNVTNLTRSAGTVTVNGTLTSDKMNATGSNNRLSATGTTVYGANNTVGGEKSGAFGNSNTVGNIGCSSFATNSFAIGNNNTIDVLSSESYTQKSFVIGNDNTLRGDNTFVMGNNINASANRAIGIGNNASVGANYAIAIGDTANASAASSVALGYGAIGRAANATAIGVNANAAQANSVAIGNGAKATEANSVALGANATTTAASTVTGGAFKTTGWKGTTAAGVVSVGASGKERQLQNVAAGAVTATSTDAINGSQFYSELYVGTAGNYINTSSNNTTAENLTALDTEIGNMQFTYPTNHATAANQGYVTNGSTVTAAINALNSNMVKSVSVGTDGKITLKQVDGSTDIVSNAIHDYRVTSGSYDAANKKVTLTATDKYNTADTETVEIAGLDTSRKVAADSGTTQTLAGGTTTKIAGGNTASTSVKNIVTTVSGASGNATVTVGLADNVSIKNLTASEQVKGNTVVGTSSVTAGTTANKVVLADNSVKVGSNTYITAGGLNASSQKIENVAAGTEDSDAVNFGQLKAGTTVSGSHNYYDGSSTPVAVGVALNAVDKAMGKQTAAGKYIAANSDSVSLATNIATLDTALGDKIATDGTYIKKSDTNSINANIQALDTALGAKTTGTFIKNTNSVNANLKALDNKSVASFGIGTSGNATITTVDGTAYNTQLRDYAIEKGSYDATTKKVTVTLKDQYGVAANKTAEITGLDTSRVVQAESGTAQTIAGGAAMNFTGATTASTATKNIVTTVSGDGTNASVAIGLADNVSIKNLTAAEGVVANTSVTAGTTGNKVVLKDNLISVGTGTNLTNTKLTVAGSTLDASELKVAGTTVNASGIQTSNANVKFTTAGISAGSQQIANVQSGLANSAVFDSTNTNAANIADLYNATAISANASGGTSLGRVSNASGMIIAAGKDVNLSNEGNVLTIDATGGHANYSAETGGVVTVDNRHQLNVIGGQTNVSNTNYKNITTTIAQGTDGNASIDVALNPNVVLDTVVTGLSTGAHSNLSSAGLVVNASGTNVSTVSATELKTTDGTNTGKLTKDAVTIGNGTNTSSLTTQKLTVEDKVFVDTTATNYYINANNKQIANVASGGTASGTNTNAANMADLYGAAYIDDAHNYYNGTTTPVTAKDAVNAVDAAIGKWKADATGTNLVAYNPANAATTSVGANLDKLDAAIGDRTAYSSTAYIANNDNVATALGKLDAGIGERVADANYIRNANSVNANLTALDTAMGTVAAGNYVSATTGTGATTLGANIQTLDSAIGAKIASDGKYIKKSDTNSVNQNIKALDDAVSGVVTTGYEFAGDTGNGNVSLGKKVTVAGDTNITTKFRKDGDNGDIEVSLNDNISVTNLTATNVAATNAALTNVTATSVLGDTITGTTSVTAGTGANRVILDSTGVNVGGKIYITSDGINANSHKITNVEAGTADTDAVNVSQLKAGSTVEGAHNYYGTAGTSMAVGIALNAVDAGLGAKITTDGNYIKKAETNTINANIKALDDALGAKPTGTYISDANSVNANLKALDDKVLTSISVGTDGVITGTTVNGSTVKSNAISDYRVTNGTYSAADKKVTLTATDKYNTANTETVEITGLDTSRVVAADSGTAQTLAGGTKTTIAGGTTAATSTKNINTAVEADGDNAKVTVALADDIKIQNLEATNEVKGATITGNTSVTAGTGTNKVVLAENSVKVGDNTYITGNGLNASSQKIINVADGEANSDAANMGQVRNMASITDAHNYYTGTESSPVTAKDAVNAVDAGLGAKITTDGNYIKKAETNSINANIKALDEAMGTWTAGTGSNLVNYDPANAATTSVGANLEKLDSAIGSRSGYTAGGNLTDGQSVTESLKVLDDAISKTVATGYEFAGDTGSDNVSLGKKVTVAGSTNITTKFTKDTTTGNGTIEVALNDNINVANVTATGAIKGDTITGTTSVTAGTGANQVVLNDKGVNVGGNTYITGSGLNASNQVITNVAAGTKDSDAANMGQVREMASITDAHNYYDGTSTPVTAKEAVNAVDKAVGTWTAGAGSNLVAYDPANAATTSVGANLDKLDAAIGDRTAYSSTAYIANNDDVATALGKLDAGIGAKVADANYVKNANSVNANLTALDTAMGKVAAGSYVNASDGTAANSHAANINALDNAIGAKIASDGKYIKKSDTNSVNKNIQALDDAISSVVTNGYTFGDGTNSSAVALGKKVDIKGGASTAGNENITTAFAKDADGNATIEVALKDDINVTSVTATGAITGDTITGTTSVTAGTGTNQVVADSTGLKVGTTASLTATELNVNGSTLNASQLSVAGTTVNASGIITSDANVKFTTAGISAGNQQITNVASAGADLAAATATTAVNAGDVVKETRVTDGGNYMATTNTAAANLTALDTAMGKVADGNYVVASDGTAATSLAANINKLDTKLGKVETTANGVSESNTFAANIDALNNTLGDQNAGITSTNYIAKNATVAENLSALDAGIGAKVTDANYVKNANTVNANIQAVDKAMGKVAAGTNYMAVYDADAGTGTMADNLTALDTAMGKVADGNYVVASDGTAATSLAANINKLDTKLGKVTTNTNGVSESNTFAANIDALNNTLGDQSALTSTNYVTSGKTVAENLSALDAGIGAKVNGEYISTSNSVNQNLYTLDQKIKETVDNGYTFGGDTGDAASPIKLGQQVSIKGGETTSGNKNITTKFSKVGENAEIEVALNKDITVDSVTATNKITVAENTTIDSNGIDTKNITAKGNITAGTGADTVELSGGNITAAHQIKGDTLVATTSATIGTGANTVTIESGNVTATGEVKGATVNASGNIYAGGDITATGAVQGNTITGTTSVTAGTGTNKVVLAENSVKVGTGSELTSTQLKVGDSSLTADKLTVGGKNYITAAGINANNNVITNVADGVANSDAVNYGQVKGAYNTASYADNKLTLTAIDGTAKTIEIKGAGMDTTAVHYDNGTTKDAITLAGAEGTTITNVKAGAISAESTDAVTGGQLYNVANEVVKTQAQLAETTKETREVGAMSAALAGLHYLEPTGEENDKFTGAVAYGGYRGESAAAVGIAYKPNPDLMFSASTSVGNSQNMYNAGASLRFGPGQTVTKKGLKKEIQAVNDKNEQLRQALEQQGSEIIKANSANAELQGAMDQVVNENAQLKSVVQEMMQRLEKVEKMQHAQKNNSKQKTGKK